MFTTSLRTTTYFPCFSIPFTNCWKSRFDQSSKPCVSKSSLSAISSSVSSTANGEHVSQVFLALSNRPTVVNNGLFCHSFCLEHLGSLRIVNGLSQRDLVFVKFLHSTRFSIVPEMYSQAAKYLPRCRLSFLKRGESCREELMVLADNTSLRSALS